MDAAGKKIKKKKTGARENEKLEKTALKRY